MARKSPTRSAIPRTPAYAFRKDQEREGDVNSASTRISPGVGIKIVTRVLACAERIEALKKMMRAQNLGKISRKGAKAQRKTQRVLLPFAVFLRLCAFARDFFTG